MGFFNKDIKDNTSAETDINVVNTKPSKRLYLVDYENVSDAGVPHLPSTFKTT